MQYLIAPFCNVCQEKFIETIHDKTNPILSVNPKNETQILSDSVKLFSVKLAKPSPNTLQVKWFLNDQNVASNIDSIYVNKSLFIPGLNSVRVEIKDTTELIRNDQHEKHHFATEWSILHQNEYVLETPELTWGDEIETRYNSNQVLVIKNPQTGVQYRWFDKQNATNAISTATNFITPKITKPTSFWVEAYTPSNTSERSKIDVLPLDKVKISKKYKTTKNENKISLEFNEKNDSHFNYRWFDENMNPIYKKGDEEKHVFDRQIEEDSKISVVNEGQKKVYVQRYNTETTCLSELIEIEL